ncbi:erythromycin esterase family protein [Streptomyces albidus (ex Kaewkla and Franco 2022)]|uniref:erythromycin esterase family protein n=1 Tax=Streptomyces albidus (ex Kaewkla and Franco 2022) TaxID=722709 RepID=UPI001F27CF97|nr:erythromycin esterase family protein [Streptomyces albidus (ex Kaewkla and Franco 2022)]
MTISPATRAEVLEWIRRTAHPLSAVELSAPLDDLRPLIGALDGRATVVGYGSGTRGAHEVFALQARIARLLVEEAGFRAVALDEDWTLVGRLDAYVRTGAGDAHSVLKQMDARSRTQEILELIEWLREFNGAHLADPVRLVGLNVQQMRDAAYDTVVEHVRRAAPERLDELNACYAELRPGADVPAHSLRFRNLPDRRMWIDRAQSAHALVVGLPRQADGHAWALRTARAIVQYYELHDHDSRPSDPRNMAYLERSFAENLTWWREHTGQKVVFWSSSSHTSDGRARAINFPPGPARVSRNTGSHLRERLGRGYVSIGLTFGSGELATYTDAPPHRVPDARPPLTESVLSAPGLGSYLLDLGVDAPPAAAEWLSQAARLRAIGTHYDPDDDASHHMTGGSLAEWFDVLVHHGHVTPSRPLGGENP